MTLFFGDYIMGIKIKRFLFCSIVIVLSCSILTLNAQSQTEVKENTINSTPSDEEIINLYEELITLRQRNYDQKMLLIEYGHSATSELIKAEASLTDARIQLAEFKGDFETVTIELEKLQRSLTDMRKKQKRDVDMGNMPIDTLIEIDSKLLETKIRLLRLKKNKTEKIIPNNDDSQLELRLNAAGRINDSDLKNKALVNIALAASKTDKLDLMKNSLARINDQSERNKAVEACVINLAKEMRTEEALLIVDMINDQNLKNDILMQIATSDFK